MKPRNQPSPERTKENSPGQRHGATVHNRFKALKWLIKIWTEANAHLGFCLLIALALILIIGCAGDDGTHARRRKPSTVPKAPEGLGIPRVESKKVFLEWKDVSENDLGFEIQRSPNGSSWKTIAVQDNSAYAAGSSYLGSRKYDDNSVQPDTTYNYRVRALGDKECNSDWSNSTGTTTPHN